MEGKGASETSADLCKITLRDFLGDSNIHRQRRKVPIMIFSKILAIGVPITRAAALKYLKVTERVHMHSRVPSHVTISRIMVSIRTTSF